MQNISLKSIKWESVRSIFQSISSAEKISRADISVETGLSLMTISKVADALLGMGVIRQVKESKSSAGRRAGLLSLNPVHYAVVLDLTGYHFTMTIVNIKLELLEEYPYAYNSDFNFEENLALFLKEVHSYFMHKNNPDACIGIGVSVPGIYDTHTDRVIGGRVPELCSVPLAETLRNTLPGRTLYIDSAINAAATSNISCIRNHRDMLILYCYIGENNISGTVVNSGTILRGAHDAAGNFGSMEIARGRTLESVIQLSNTPEENATELARALHNLTLAIDPDRIILECELYKNGDEFADMVRACLRDQYAIAEDALPSLGARKSKICHAHRGLTIKLRELWISRLILSDSEP